MTRARQDWVPNADAKQYLDKVEEILDSSDYKPFWPLTLRQLYYALVGQLVIENTKEEYKKLVRLMSLGRLSGRIPWEALMDNNRDMLENGGFADMKSFVDYSKRDFLSGFNRNLSQTQPVNVEVWVEKDALARVVDEVAQDYCVSTVVAKGYASVSYVNALRERIDRHMRSDRPTKILYFGDLDPSGWNMLPAMFTTLWDEMGVGRSDANYTRCALNPDQVSRYKLPKNPDALKDDEWQRTRGDSSKTKGDPRAEAYKEMFGNLAVELDALKPRQLQDIVRRSIIDEFDMDLYDAEVDKEIEDQKKLEDLKEKVSEVIEDLLDPTPPSPKKKTPRKR